LRFRILENSVTGFEQQAGEFRPLDIELLLYFAAGIVLIEKQPDGAP